MELAGLGPDMSTHEHTHGFLFTTLCSLMSVVLPQSECEKEQAKESSIPNLSSFTALLHVFQEINKLLPFIQTTSCFVNGSPEEHISST